MKIALNYWYFVVDNRRAALNVHQAVREGGRPWEPRLRCVGRPADYYQIVERPPIPAGEPPSHRLLAVGDPHEGVAYVHVILFDVYSQRIVIDYFYRGSAFAREQTVVPFSGGEPRQREFRIPRLQRKSIVRRRLWTEAMGGSYMKDLQEVCTYYGIDFVDLPEGMRVEEVW